MELTLFQSYFYFLISSVLLCEMAKADDVEVLYDSIVIDNPAILLFLKMDFLEEYRTEEIIMVKKS